MQHTKEQRLWAAAYRISFSEEPEGVVFAQKDMDQDSALLRFLQQFADAVQSPASQVTGSLFIKRYCLLISGALHGLIRSREAIDLSPDNVLLVWKDGALDFVLQSAAAPSLLNGLHDDEAILTRYLDHLFADQVCPMLQRIAEVTRIDSETLWANLSYNLAYWKNDWLKNSNSNEEQDRIMQYYLQVTGTFRKERFPGMSVNPVTDDFKYADNPLEPDDPILVRSKCCLYYCLPGNDRYCYTCPRISEQKRAAKYAEIHGK